LRPDRVVDRLITEAKQIGVEVYEAKDPQHLRHSLVDFLTKRYATHNSVCIPLEGFPLADEIIPELKTKGWDVLQADNSIKFEEFLERLKHIQVGISPIDLSIAETSTLVIRNNRPFLREISLLPPVHIAIVGKDQIVLDMSTASELIDGWLTESLGVTFITGPSKTADIELNLVKGVHGPKELIIFILSQCQSLLPS